MDPQFGYADGFDEASGKYHGLLWGRDPPQPFSATAMLVSDVATKKQLAEMAAAGQPAPTKASAAPGASPGATVQSMLHLGAKCASDPDRNLILLAIADIGDIRIMLVDAAISEQAGIVSTRTAGNG